MTVYQDLMSDEQIDVFKPRVEMTLQGQSFSPNLMTVTATSTATEVKELVVRVELDNSEDIAATEPLWRLANYTLEEIKARVFTRIPVVISWQAKPELLQRFQSELLQNIEDLFEIKDTDGQALFTHLSESYTLKAIEA